ncbi:MAG: HAMP domain-containing histidine kinase [Ramlibacter sp.]|nr:HAMP domain-containing histidine kinase [Ramlibacter sp.]
MFKVTTPPKMFAAMSLLMIVATVVGTGLIQAPFFRQAIIDREAVMVGDVVNALARVHGLSGADMRNYSEAAARERLDDSFGPLKQLPGTERVRVFNRDNVIVWSDADGTLVGKKRTANLDHLTRAAGGQVQAVFNTLKSDVNSEHPATSDESIECYVPLFARDAGRTGADVIGVLALYRDPHDLNRTIRNGLLLLWSITGAAGLLLFFALYKVFNVVYSRQVTAESKFSKLTLEHERIVQIEKMSAMGELVGEIAHQLNNPLVGVINLTQLAERQVQDPRRVSELLAEVRKAGTECRDIVQRILRINQSSRSTLQRTDMGELVQDTIAFCHHSIALKHSIAYAPPAHTHMLEVDPVLMRQALFNLIHNAILAAPQQQVRVALETADHDGAAGIALVVSDSGPGFSADMAPKLFKPFFTTRSNGTGLGLPVAQHIAMKHGGVVLAENVPAGGARFSIWLPATTTP